MRMTRPAVAVVVLALACGGPAAAQTATTPPVEGLTLAQTLDTLARTAGSAATSEALILGTVLEIGTTPLPTASPGFIYKVDPATGLRVRQATTFGPSFTERALTSGEGKVAVYASVSAASYEQFGDLKLERMQLSSVSAASPLVQRRGLASLVIQAETLTMATSVGVTDKFDLSVSVPLVRVSLDGIAWMEDGTQRVLVRAEGAGTATGLGDIAMTGKYRLTGAGEGPPDPGGLAVIGTARLPTGDRDNFRGLGITRLLGSVVYSRGKGRFRPHGNAGFEYWSDSLDALTEGVGSGGVSARHQFQYAAGFEFEGAPKLTLLVDLLGRHILGAGEVGVVTTTPASNSVLGQLGATAVESVVPTDQGINKLMLVPGLKLNLKGNFLLSLNVLTSLRDNGLHDRVIPVFGLEWTF